MRWFFDEQLSDEAQAYLAARIAQYLEAGSPEEVV